MDFKKWTAEDLEKYISSLGYVSESKLFRRAEIDGSVLSLIREEHLKEIGLNLVGPRLLIFQEIKKLLNQSYTPPNDVYERKKSNLPSISKPEIPTMEKPTPPPQKEASEKKKTILRPTTAQIPPKPDETAIEKARREHDQMVKTIRASRKYLAYQKALEDGTAVGPPPELAPIQEPEGLVQCPSCGRKMSTEAAKHHFPVCERMTMDKTFNFKTRK